MEEYIVDEMALDTVGECRGAPIMETIEQRLSEQRHLEPPRHTIRLAMMAGQTLLTLQSASLHRAFQCSL